MCIRDRSTLSRADRDRRVVAKVRVYELTKEFGIESKAIMAKLNELGEFVRSASSTIEPPVVRKLRAVYPAGSVPAPAAAAPAVTKPVAAPAPAPAPAVEAPSTVAPSAPAAPSPFGTASGAESADSVTAGDAHPASGAHPGGCLLYTSPSPRD